MSMTIVLKWKYLHYDIDQLTYRYGKVHTTDEENKELAQTTAGNESDTNLVRRLVVTGTARLRRILADYITAKVEDANDTLPTEKAEWSFTFNDDVEADGHALAELMHWFVVRWCIYEWCKMFAPEQAPLEKAGADELKKDLERMMHGDSSMPTKEPLKNNDEEYVESVVITYEPDEP